MRNLFSTESLKKTFSSAFIFLILFPLGSCKNNSLNDNIVIASYGKILSADPAQHIS